MGQLLGKETTITMTVHTQYNSQQLAGGSCTTEDTYIHYQATKHTNRQTDPLDAILEHIKDNPQAYANRLVHSGSNNIQNTHVEQQPKNISQGRRQDPIQKTVNNPREDNISTQQSKKSCKNNVWENN